MPDEIDDVIVVKLADVRAAALAAPESIEELLLNRTVLEAAERAELIAERRGLVHPVIVRIIDGNGKVFLQFASHGDIPERPRLNAVDPSGPELPWYLVCEYANGVVKIRIETDDERPS